MDFIIKIKAQKIESLSLRACLVFLTHFIIILELFSVILNYALTSTLKKISSLGFYKFRLNSDKLPAQEHRLTSGKVTVIL